MEPWMAVSLAVGIPLLTWGIWLSWVIRVTASKVATLEMMHLHADKYGFGTGTTNKLIEDNTAAMRALTHYIVWFIEHQSGEKPPPPKPEVI
jgi:hypothetical protein